MKNFRTYGAPPFHVAVIHGGPGAAGEMAPVARELSSARGVLEPLQTAHSLDAQVAELKSILEKHAQNDRINHFGISTVLKQGITVLHLFYLT